VWNSSSIVRSLIIAAPAREDATTDATDAG
jgi:hypothetical protein